MVGSYHVLALWLMMAGVGHTSEGARILGVFPVPATSHQNVMTSLMKELARRGHDVTVVTPVPQKQPLKNYKEIILDFTLEDIKPKGMDMYSMSSTMNSLTSILMLWGMCYHMSVIALETKNMQDLIQSKEKFDLVVVEAFAMEVFLGFAHKFQTPVVQISPFGAAEWIGDAVGNPNPYAYVPDFSLNYNDHMTFFQRMHNTLVGMMKKILRVLYHMPRQNSLMHQYFNGTGPGPLPHVSDIETKTSLVLLNNHVSISNPQPYMPNMVEVGGMHISPPKKLPQDLQKFLDEAKDGVVYFSMGSNLKSADMPAEKRDALLQAFAKLKQKVLWKWEADSLPGQPKNVKLSKWLPQSDLLAHPNIKVFITHGGLLSTQEALYHGVPVIGIPIFGDQELNSKRAVSAGYGIGLVYKHITTDTVSEAIDEILKNSKYSENAKRLSRTFRDQPRTPLETAAYWTEYVIRHKGAYHMRSAVMDLYWYQYYLLDVLGILGAAALATFLALFLILRTAYRCIFPSKKSPKVKDSKKKK